MKKNKSQPFKDPSILRIGTVSGDIYGNKNFDSVCNFKQGKLHHYFIFGLN